MKVALFVPCYMDQFYPKTAIATLELLEKLGCEVFYPENQTCCGQPMANSGYEHLSGSCTALFQDNFNDYDYVVSPSGSCTLHVKEHIELKGKVYELIEFITDVLKIESLEGSFPHKVGLHQSCHGQRGLFLSQMSELNAAPFSKPELLLRNLKGIELQTLSRKDECCGFGGTFCVTEEAVSVRMGKDRVADHMHSGVEIIIGGDTSCLMHMEGIIKRDNNAIKVMHIAEVLNQAIS